MRSKTKSTLRTALTYIGIFICGAVLVVLLLSFFDNTLNGTLREWFYRCGGARSLANRARSVSNITPA